MEDPLGPYPWLVCFFKRIWILLCGVNGEISKRIPELKRSENYENLKSITFQEWKKHLDFVIGS